MNFRKFYGRRLHYMFRFSRKSMEYRTVKVLCLIVGLPIALVLFVVEMAVALIYMIFMRIPILNVVMLFLCRFLTSVCSVGFYICIIPELPEYLDECENDLYVTEEQPLLLLTGEVMGEEKSDSQNTEKAKPTKKKKN